MIFLQIGQLTTEVSVLVLLIIGIKFLLKKKLTPSAGYFLWIFVAFRILVPFRIGLSPNFFEAFGGNQITFFQQETSGDGAIKEEIAKEETGKEEASLAAVKKDAILQELINRTEHKETGRPIGEPGIKEPEMQDQKGVFIFGKYAYGIWLSGSLLAAAYVLWLNVRLSVTLKAKRKYIGMLKPGLPLYDMPGYNCLAGVFSPSVYVDVKGLGQRSIIEDVIRHELQHYRIRDNVWQMVRILCLVLQWYNPFVWWAYVSSRRDCELACDFRVFRGMTSEERYQYGRSLLAVAEVMLIKKHAAYLATSAGDSKRFMERRIMNIMGYKRKKIARGLAASLTVLLVILCFASFREPLGEIQGETGNMEGNHFMEENPSMEEPQVSSGDSKPGESGSPDEPYQVELESTGNYILSDNYQKKALRLGDFTYIALGHMLYKVNDENQIEQSIECEEAVGTFVGDNLYWAILNAEKNIQIIKIDEQGQISEVGIIEENQPPSFLDFYEDVIYLGFKLGNVVGYRIDSNDKLAGPLSADEMEFYKEENQAADIRLHDPNDRDAILAYPYHIVNAGYTKAATGQEFLARHTRTGDIGREEFILRANGKDTVLFSYSEDAIIDQGKIAYMENIDKNKLFVYDLQTGENKKIFELQDGNLDLLAFSHDRIYGVWKSIKELKSFFVYIDLEQAELVSCFETVKGTEYIVINDTVYYIDQASGNLAFKTL